MAQKVNIVVTDDLDGSEGASTVNFGLDGTSYDIDLSDKNADKLRKALQPYVDAGRRVSGGRRSSGRKAGGSGRSDLADVRAWAKDKGMEVSDRGRVSQDILDAYDSAH